MTVIFQPEKLRQRRREKKLTQETLAELCDCSPRYLRDLETGVKSNPSGTLLLRLSFALELPAEDLFFLEEKKSAISVR